MADLTDPLKREIVEALASFSSLAEIVKHFRAEHGIELTARQVGSYDPSRTYYDAGEKWIEVFNAKRAAYLSEVADIPIANQGYRLRMLQKGAADAAERKNWPLMASLLEQAAKEVGGVLTNERNLRVDDRRAGIDAMTSDERRMAVADLIRQALEAPPMKLAQPVTVDQPEGNQP